MKKYNEFNEEEIKKLLIGRKVKVIHYNDRKGLLLLDFSFRNKEVN